MSGSGTAAQRGQVVRPQQHPRVTVADFENQFPYLRVLNLSLEPSSAAAGNDREKLSFKMEVAALVKPSTS